MAKRDQTTSPTNVRTSRRKKRKSATKRKGKASAYTLFTKHMWAKHGDDWREKGLSVAVATKDHISKEWRGMSDNEKEKWKKKAKMNDRTTKTQKPEEEDVEEW